MKPALTLDLAQLASDPSRVTDVPQADIPRLIGETEELRAQLWSRLQAPAPTATPNGNAPDRLLTVVEATEILAVDKRWLYRNADSLPFTRRIGSRALRFSERGLRRWVETRK